MDEKLITEIGSIIKSFNQSLESHLPALEKELKLLIESKCTDTKTIEHYLDTLLSLAMHGIGEKLFIQLLDYYKTIDSEGALFYWNQYDSED
jgi:hypothetical protein